MGKLLVANVVICIAALLGFAAIVIQL